MGGVCCVADDGTKSKAEMEYEKKMTKLIETAMAKEKKDDDSVLKLLLLGTGESGKSTLFKQIVQLYGKGFDVASRMPYASIVYTNVIVSIKTLLKQSEKLDAEFHTALNANLVGSRNFLLNEVKADSDVSDEIARHIRLVWDDPGIKRTFDHRNRFQVTDSCRYFFNKIEEIGSAGYIPTYQDMLQCRARTTGIVETKFEIDDNTFKMVDVGGQRNERKKWIHCFENVTAVIFVAAINEYDQVLYEDGTTNRVDEALNLFGEICNSRWFRETSMILFLNKRDLFMEKIQTVDLAVHFPDYKGGLDYQAAIEFLEERFLEKNEFPDRKQVYLHITCATDTDSIAFTFNVVKDIIIKERLKECGLLEY